MTIFTPIAATRRSALLLLVFSGLLLSSGCQVIDKLRGIFHPEQGAADSQGHSGLKLTIKPSENIEVFLDGEPVATESPYEIETLKAEKHQLHIESEGYHSFSLLFELTENETLSLPIELRKKERAVEPHDSQTAQNAPGYDRGPPTQAGIKPAALIFASDPVQPILWDGQEAPATGINLDRVWGVLEAGHLRVSYKYNEVGILELYIPKESTQPNETITWLRDKTPLKGGDIFRLPKGRTPLIRISNIHGRQILVIERH